MQFPHDDFQVEELVCDEAFQQFCLGKTIEDQIRWQEWIEKRPDRIPDFEEAKRLVEILIVKQGSRLHQVEALKNAIKQKAKFSAAVSNPGPKFHYSYLYITGIAAILFLVAFALFYLNSSTMSLKNNPTLEHFSAGRAFRRTIVLKDGSVVILGAGSNIHFKTDFAMNRELWLSGEAFFDVKKDAKHPFIVHTAFNDIRVLGTVFNVRAYPRAKEMETILIRGSVRVESKRYPGKFAILKPNEKLIANNPLPTRNASLNPIFRITTQVKATDIASKEVKWVKKRFEIENQPLEVIAERLEGWFGIEIEIQDETVRAYHYSGIFEDENIIKILEALQLSYPFKFTADQNKITISK